MQCFYATHYSHGIITYSADCAAQPKGAAPLARRWFAYPSDALAASVASGTLAKAASSWI
jgi:hypothetical protein